jgi:hypothetical protein
MLSLEHRTYDSKREMDLMEHLEAIRMYNRNHLSLHPGLLLANPALLDHLAGKDAIQQEN